MVIVITGATGLIGSCLGKKLTQQGHTVHILTRDPLSDKKIDYEHKSFLWANSYELPNEKAFPSDVKFGVIHLAGESISEWPWTKIKKKNIYDSRITGTQNLIKVFEKLNNFPEFFISTSAVGVYGDTKNIAVTESYKIEDQKLFLQKICKDWEAEALKLEQFSRVVILRLGIVFSKKSTFLKQQLSLLKFFVPLLLSFRKIYFAWIHIDDLCSVICNMTHNNSKGIYNATAPEPSNWSEFYNEMALKLNKKYFRIPTFIFIIKFILGEMGKNMFVSCGAIPQKLQKEKFQFKYKNLSSALDDLLKDT